MRKFLRKLYEKENKIYEAIIYYFLLTAFKVFKKYKSINKEIISAIETFESPEISQKEYKKIYRKMIIFRYVYSLRASEYYLFGIKGRPYEEIDAFMPRRHTNKYYSVINSKKYRKVFDKKILSYEVFGKYYKRDVICITNKRSNKEDKLKFQQFINGKKGFILKPLAGHSGNGIEIIRTKDFANKEEIYKYTLKKVPYVAEELIVQSNSLGCFHPESVNTIRVVTFQYNNCVSILWAFLRTGQGDNSVDNMGSAGLGALIDHKKGVIISDGLDWKGTNIPYHPDSKIKFKGYKIPCWDDLVETVKGLASEISEMHCVGWDLAHTKNGWVLVEGNARPQCVTVQTITKKGYKSYYDKMCTLVRKQKSIEEQIFEGKIEV